MPVTSAKHSIATPVTLSQRVVIAVGASLLGQLVRGLGYWRLGVFNVGDAHFRRDRVDASGAVPLISRSSMQWTPRAYLTVGTQF